jgi:DNA-binding IclR family transcriptional regulator
VPPRHHRTIDRTIAILEAAGRSADGLTLAEFATLLDAPKSSIQELANGLLATGYLVESDRRFSLGPGAYVLSLRTTSLPLRQVRHEELERAHQRAGLTLFVGTRVGDDQVFVDQAGDDVLVDLVYLTHPRRPLLMTATGKIILAYMASAERIDFLRRMERGQPEQVAAFLEALPGIRTSALAYNYGAGVPDRYTVATPLLDPNGVFLAAICAAGGVEAKDRLVEVGQTLRDAVAGWRFPRQRGRTIA